MTSRERILAALEHREPDRTPVFEYVLLSPLADTLLGRPYVADCNWGPAWQACLAERGYAGAVRQAAVDQVELAARLGFDMIYAIPAPPQTSRPPSPAANDEPDDPVERIRRSNDQSAARLGQPLPDERFEIHAFMKEEMARRGLDLPLLAPAWSHGIWTNVDLMQTMVLAPEVAHAYFAWRTRASLQLAEKYLSLGIDLVGVGGDFAGNRPLISPQMYHEFIMPEVRTVSRYVHRSGGRTVNASDGNLWSVIDDFLIGCEVDGYAEIDLHAGMDLRTLKQRFGERITFFGNLDCGNTLSFGSADDVRRHVRECLEAGLGRGGHVLCASNAITASIPLENYLAVIATYRDMFHLPPLRL